MWLMVQVNRNNNLTDNLFSKNNIDQNIVNSINGATALKLDESYEIKNSEEQNAVIESFESEEENQIAEESSHKINQKMSFLAVYQLKVLHIWKITQILK